VFCARARTCCKTFDKYLNSVFVGRLRNQNKEQKNNRLSNFLRYRHKTFGSSLHQIAKKLGDTKNTIGVRNVSERLRFFFYSPSKMSWPSLTAWVGRCGAKLIVRRQSTDPWTVHGRRRAFASLIDSFSPVTSVVLRDGLDRFFYRF